VNTRTPTIDAFQQIRNGCVLNRPTPQKKALVTAGLVRDIPLTKPLPEIDGWYNHFLKRSALSATLNIIPALPLRRL
jgi:hypothetical protein